MSKKAGLGRGLAALIPPTDETVEKAPAGPALLTVPVEAISPNPRQPRSQIDPEQLTELADSIREHGVLQPIVVNRAEGERYTLIAGERRWRAAQLAGLSEVPVIIKETTPQHMLELALIENIQRADLNALEEAQAYHALMADFGLTQEELSKRVGKGRSTIANSVRILDLPDDVQAAVLRSQISAGHARALASLDSGVAQIAVMRTVMRNELNVRQTEAIVQKLVEGRKPRRKPARQLPPELADLETRFQESLGTRVQIERGATGGRVVIHYYSDEELQAIYEAIVRDKED
jgi:ParB family chromosome partitioning protein